MTSLPPRALAFGIAVCMGTVAPSATLDQAMPQAGPAVTSQSTVDPQAVAALKRMSAYLTTLNTFEIRSEGSLDVVTDEGQRVQLDGVTNYKVRRPGFVIDFESDLKSRRFIYDGKNFTVYAPKMDFYATVPAPATNREVLELVYNQYGIKLPLEDLFRWNDPNSVRSDKLISGYQLGTATLDGVKTDHFVFREKEIDWEVWIQQGDQPLPRKMVIIDRTQSEYPTFIARLQWKVNPTFTDADFAFTPDKDAKRIELAIFEGTGE